MGRLVMRASEARVYLCGPINNRTDEDCKDWREWVKSKWPGKTLDPMRRDYRGKENENVNQIVEFDKIDLMNSDIILVNYDGPSVGTTMEILYAFERGKWVIVVAPEGTQISPWLRYHSHVIVRSFADALRWVELVVMQ
jgi:nucleoside 2-deoxyribosyltransferase